MTIAFDPLALLQEAGHPATNAATPEQTDEGDAFEALLEIFRGLLDEAGEDVSEDLPVHAAPGFFDETGGELALGVHLQTTPDPQLDRTHFTLRAALTHLAPETDAPATPTPVPTAQAEDATLPRSIAPTLPTPEGMATLPAPTPVAPTETRPAEDLPMPSAPAAPDASPPAPAQNTAPLPTAVAELRPQAPNEPAAPARTEGTIENAAQPVVSSQAADTGDGQSSGFGSRGNEGEALPRPPVPMAPPVEPTAENFSIGRAGGPTAPAEGPAVSSALSTPTTELPARITWLAQQGGGTARLALHPAELGEVEVAVRVRGNSVEVQFLADDPAAQLAVSNARDSLMESLGARELRMESFQVRGADDAASFRDFAGSPERDAQNTRDETSGRDAGSQQQATNAPKSQVASVTPGEAIASLVTPVAPNTDSGIDVRV